VGGRADRCIDTSGLLAVDSHVLSTGPTSLSLCSTLVASLLPPAWRTCVLERPFTVVERSFYLERVLIWRSSALGRRRRHHQLSPQAKHSCIIRHLVGAGTRLKRSLQHPPPRTGRSEEAFLHSIHKAFNTSKRHDTNAAYQHCVRTFQQLVISTDRLFCKKK